MGFRLILAIPHILLVGTPGGVGGLPGGRVFSWFPFAAVAGNGVLGLVAFMVAVISWFAIVFTRKHPRGLWDLTSMYMRWRTKAVAYIALLRDEYPPFGEGDYPVSFETSYPEIDRDRWSVGLRLIYVIPHAIIVFLLGIGWLFTTILAWFAILLTGDYPQGLYSFGVGVMRWSIRVEAYVLLMRDEYPPFSLD